MLDNIIVNNGDEKIRVIASPKGILSKEMYVPNNIKPQEIA